jgi:hypothetical protein
MGAFPEGNRTFYRGGQWLQPLIIEHATPDHHRGRPQRRGTRLFRTIYQPLVDGWVLYDNAGDQPVLTDWSGNLMTPPQAPCSDWPPGTDPYFKGSLDALRRAALRARELARQTGTGVVVMRAGRIVYVMPDLEQCHHPD